VGGPQGDYPPPVVAALKTYVDGGGRMLVMLDNTLAIGRGEPAAENAELAKLLSDWGVTANKDLVLDLSGLGRLFGAGPEVPMVTSYESHPITQPLARGIPTAFPMARSFETKSAGNASSTKLFGTGEDSIAVDKLGRDGSVDPKSGKKGPLTLGAAITISGATAGRVVVVGTSLWAQNNLIGSRQLGNRDLFGNIVNWLMADEDLISIRPKSPEDRPLNITAQKLSLVFWLSVVIFPLAVVGFGMATWWKRR
jgi:gliding motility-associatede transport system auxiliary component